MRASSQLLFFPKETRVDFDEEVFTEWERFDLKDEEAAVLFGARWSVVSAATAVGKGD